MKSHFVSKFLAFVLASLGMVALAQSAVAGATCETDCHGLYHQWYQSYELHTCLVERHVHCSTNVSDCSQFEQAPFQNAFNAAKAAVTQANRVRNFPKDRHQCHAVVDAATYDLLMIPAYEFAGAVHGFADQADAAARAAGAWDVEESYGSYAIAQCACSAATYSTANGDSEFPGPQNNGYLVSGFANYWSYSFGQNNEQSKAELRSEMASHLGSEAPLKTFESAFPLNGRNLTEAICREGSTWAVDAGTLSIPTVRDDLLERGYNQCLLKTVAFSGERSVSDDQFFVSMQDGGDWAMQSGPVERREEFMRLAYETIDLEPETLIYGYYSSHRLTETTITCLASATSAEEIYSFVGLGQVSIYESFSFKNNQIPDHSCRWNVRDVDFGPVVKLSEDTGVDVPSTFKVQLRNNAGMPVRVTLNAPHTRTIVLNQGHKLTFDVAVERLKIPEIFVHQADGTRTDIPVGDGDEYVFFTEEDRTIGYSYDFGN